MSYYEKKVVSFSLLKEYYQSLHKAKGFIDRMTEDKDIVETQYFTIGNIVDTLLTEPLEFDNKFMIASKLPPPALSALTEEVISIINYRQISVASIIENETDLEEVVLEARRKISFQSNWKDETVVNKFKEGCLDYISLYNECKEAGKSLITREQEIEGRELVDKLKNGRYTGEYFHNVDKEFNQVELYWSFNGIEFKSKLDKVIVKNKNIFVTDVKTYFLDFLDGFYNHKLFLQGSMYYTPIRLLRDTIEKPSLLPEEFTIDIDQKNKEFLEIIKDPTYKLYKGFIFLTVDKSGKNPPIPYVLPESKLMDYISEVSIVRKDNGNTIILPGWMNKAKDLWDHVSTDNWEYPLELIDTNTIKL